MTASSDLEAAVRAARRPVRLGEGGVAVDIIIACISHMSKLGFNRDAYCVRYLDQFTDLRDVFFKGQF